MIHKVIVHALFIFSEQVLITIVMIKALKSATVVKRRQNKSHRRIENAIHTWLCTI